MTEKQTALKALKRIRDAEFSEQYHGHSHIISAIIRTCEHRLIEAGTVADILSSVEGTLADAGGKGFALVAEGLEGTHAALRDILERNLDARLETAYHWTVGTLATAFERAWKADGHPVTVEPSRVKASVEAILYHMELDPWVHDVSLHPTDITSGDDPFWEAVDQYLYCFTGASTSDALRDGLYYDVDTHRWHIDAGCEFEGVDEREMAQEGYECIADAHSAYEHALHMDEPVRTKEDWDLERADQKYAEMRDEGRI